MADGVAEWRRRVVGLLPIAEVWVVDPKWCSIVEEGDSVGRVK